MAEEQGGKGTEWAGFLEVISLRKGNKARKGQEDPRDQVFERELLLCKVGRTQAGCRGGWGQGGVSGPELLGEEQSYTGSGARE